MAKESSGRRRDDDRDSGRRKENGSSRGGEGRDSGRTGSDKASKAEAPQASAKQAKKASRPAKASGGGEREAKAARDEQPPVSQKPPPSSKAAVKETKKKLAGTKRKLAAPGTPTGKRDKAKKPRVEEEAKDRRAEAKGVADADAPPQAKVDSVVSSLHQMAKKVKVDDRRVAAKGVADEAEAPRPADKAATEPKAAKAKSTESKQATKAATTEPKQARVSDKEKSAKPSHPQKSEKADKERSPLPRRPRTEKSERSEKPDKAEKAEMAENPEKIDKSKGMDKAALPRRRGVGPCAATSLGDAEAGGGDAGVRSCSGSYSAGRSSSGSSGSGSSRRKRQKERESQRGASGFSTGLGAAPPPPPPGTGELNSLGPGGAVFGPLPAETALVPLAEKVKGLLDNQQGLAKEMERMKQAMKPAAAKEPAGASAGSRGDDKEGKETVLRMPPRLHEALLHPDNEAQLLARTGLSSASLNEDGLVVLRADSKKVLTKALGQLRRVAYHCQWGASKEKVASLLTPPPTKPVHTTVVRLAATSSRLQSFELRLNNKQRKLRIGTQAGACQMAVEGIPGLSRKHCTITFEPEKGACYVQDLSTNGTYFNGKRLPRPPYKNPQDARVRVFHGDELFFRLKEKDSEELGYVINLLELS